MMRYLTGVVTLALEEELCIGCGRCIEVCPHGVFDMKDSKAVIIDRDACIECGACAGNCPAGAITVDAGVGCAAAQLGLYSGEKGCCSSEDGCC